MKADVPLIVTAVTISLLFVGSLLVYPLNPYSFGSGAEFGPEEYGDVAVNVGISSASPTEYGIVLFETVLNTDRAVHIYIDKEYAGMTGIGFQEEFANGLIRELGLRNFGNSIEYINAEGLETLLGDMSDAVSHNIVFASGAFPDNVYEYDGAGGSFVTDLITPWVDAGGMITWVAGKFGYYSAPKDPGYNGWLTDEGQPGAEGVAHFFGADVINPSETISYAGSRTPMADAASLVHNEITNGVLEGYVTNYDNGVMLGYTGSGYSSVSFLYNSTVTGGYLIFGGTTLGVTYLTDAVVAQTIASCLYGAADEPVFKKGTMKGSMSTELTISSVNDETAVCIYVYTGSVMSTYGKLHRNV